MILFCVFRFGTDELKREYLAPSISGDVVSCLGVSEPSAGSDVAGSYLSTVVCKSFRTRQFF